MSHLHRFLILLGLMSGFGGVTAQGQERQSSAEQADRAELLTRVAKEYQFSVAGDVEHRLTRGGEPLQSWTNPERATDRGLTWLWTDRGRPMAIACIYTYGDNAIDHEFQSLATRPLHVKRGERVVWEPVPGIEPMPLPGADKPAARAAARLLQMRSLARRFQALVYQNQDRHELRLLPQPLYRYDSADQGIRDGGLFAFVQATDPEVLLLLEAIDTQSGPVWHYSLARMTDKQLEAKLDEQTVWRLDGWAWQTRTPSQTYIKFTETVSE